MGQKEIELVLGWLGGWRSVENLASRRVRGYWIAAGMAADTPSIDSLGKCRGVYGRYGMTIGEVDVLLMVGR